MWGKRAHKGPGDASRRVSDQPSGHQTRSYLYDPVPTSDLHRMSAFMMEPQQPNQQPPSQQPAANSEHKLEHLQDVAGLKLMVMQLEKAREAMAQEKKKKMSFSWSHVLYEFSQNTTMHGLAKTTEDTPFLLRRMIWILVVLGGISLFLYQLSTSVMTYLSYPVTVNVQINYNKSLEFPAVTICNLNVFRTTKAAEFGYYDIIDKIFDPAHNGNISQSQIPPGMTLEKLYTALVHDKNDMIKSCQWDGNHCSAEDFVISTTDHGVCHTFNALRREGEVFTVTQTGSDHGLRVRLNVEQYEYMRGPNKGAGIKVLVHGRNDVALVRDLGQAVAPGAHAFIGIQLKKMTNLKPPFGECDDSVQLKYYREYTQSTCSIDCLERYLESKCNCRLPYMAKDQVHDFPVVCSMDSFLNCVPGAMTTFNRDRMNYCRCPVPCQKLIYDSSVTYASTSHFDTDQVLQTANTAALQRKYIAAKEVHQRVDKQILAHDIILVDILSAASSKVDISFRDINNSLADAQSSMENIQNEINHRAFFHKYVMRKVVMAYEYWFQQGWELTSKMIDELIGGHAGFMKTYNNTMRALTEHNNQPSFKEVLKWQITEEASERFHLAEKVIYELERVQKSFNYSEPMFFYNIQFAENYSSLLIPKAALKLRRNYSFIIFGFNHNYLVNIVDRYENLWNAAKAVTIDSAFQFDSDAFMELYTLLLDDMESINHGQKTTDREVVHHPWVILTKSRDSFESTLKGMEKECGDLLTTIKKTQSLLNNIERIWQSVKNFISDSRKYLSSNEIGKSDLSNAVNMIDNQVEAIRTFFTDVRARGRNLDHDWTKVFIMYKAAMTQIATEPATKALYTKLNEDVELMLSSSDTEAVQQKWKTLPFPKTPGNGNADENWLGNDLLQYRTYANLDTANINETDVENLVVELREKVNNSSDIYQAIGNTDIDFFAAFDEWEKVLDDFNASTKVDGTFFRENFIDLDIYLTELYYEEIHQQQSYGLTSLFSDIGGNMGLFMGASIITIIELIDIIFLSLFKTKCSCRP